MTHARLAPLHGLRVGPVSLRDRTPFHYANRTLTAELFSRSRGLPSAVQRGRSLRRRCARRFSEPRSASPCKPRTQANVHSRAHNSVWALDRRLDGSLFAVEAETRLEPGPWAQDPASLVGYSTERPARGAVNASILCIPKPRNEHWRQPREDSVACRDQRALRFPHGLLVAPSPRPRPLRSLRLRARSSRAGIGTVPPVAAGFRSVARRRTLCSGCASLSALLSALRSHCFRSPTTDRSHHLNHCVWRIGCPPFSSHLQTAFDCQLYLA